MIICIQAATLLLKHSWNSAQKRSTIKPTNKSHSKNSQIFVAPTLPCEDTCSKSLCDLQIREKERLCTKYWPQIYESLALSSSSSENRQSTHFPRLQSVTWPFRLNVNCTFRTARSLNCSVLLSTSYSSIKNCNTNVILSKTEETLLPVFLLLSQITVATFRPDIPSHYIFALFHWLKRRDAPTCVSLTTALTT